MNNIKDLMRNYLELENTDYSIEINGSWGIGKTYFIKKFIEDEKIFFYKNKMYPIYISLNGLNELTVFQDQLLSNILNIENESLEVTNKVTKKIFPYIDLLGSKAEILTKFAGEILANRTDNNLKGLSSSKPKYILFLDDLERISENISYKELFGYISAICLDKFNMKILFIVNESEILENRKPEYYLIKEKVIFNTFEFQPDKSDILNGLFSNYSPKKFFLSNKEELLSLFNFVCSESVFNLRTIKYVLNSFSFLTRSIEKNEFKLENKEKIYKLLIINLLLVSIEYKEGNLLKSEDLLPLYKEKRFQLVPSEQKHIKILEKYHFKNNDFDSSIYYSESITTYVINGYFDVKQYLEDIAKYFIEPIESEENTSLDILSDFRNHTQEEVAEAQQVILSTLNYIDEGTIKTCDLLYQYKKMNLYFLQENPILKIIQTIMNKEYDKESIIKLSNDWWIIETTYSNLVSQKEFTSFKDLINSESIKLQSKKTVSLIEESLSDNYNSGIIYDKFRPYYQKDLKIFTEINQNENLINQIVQHKSKANFITKILNYKYTDTNLSSDEFKDLQELHGKINILLKEKDNLDSIDKYIINELLHLFSQYHNRKD